MSYEEVKKVWMNGRLVDFADAKIHAYSHVFHYGSAMFDGLRVYKTKNGSAAFRLDEHIKRLYDSCKVYRMEIPYSPEEFKAAIFDTIRANGFEECYIRPVVYRGLGALGVNPFKSPIDVCVAVWKWGKYLGEEAIEQGVDVCVSSWNRMAPNTFPAMAKATGNYLNSALIKMEAITNGYSEGIALDNAGRISEGSGENIFFVYGGRILTPPLAGTILPGITRDSIIALAKDSDTRVREEAYTIDQWRADAASGKLKEAFACGTAAVISPIGKVCSASGDFLISGGAAGPVAMGLRKKLIEIQYGRAADPHNWIRKVL